MPFAISTVGSTAQNAVHRPMKYNNDATWTIRAIRAIFLPFLVSATKTPGRAPMEIVETGRVVALFSPPHRFGHRRAVLGTDFSLQPYFRYSFLKIDCPN